MLLVPSGSEGEGFGISQRYYILDQREDIPQMLLYLLDPGEKNSLVLSKDVTFNGLETEGLSISKKWMDRSGREDC
jgi:hypothetical protein